jgi:iron(III) transport system ATP-binding protein
VDGLVVENLTKRYGDVTAVNDVSFTVAPGEFVSLLGPSGCGKTTTLRCIAGFERPSDGLISIGSETVTQPAKNIFVPPNHRHFGMVFQSYAVWPHMTVLDNVGYPLRVKGKLSRSQVRERAQDKLRTVGLDGYEGRYPSQLSGGQQQRVSLARALVMEPRVLLFDEPLSNLDAKLRERMRFELIEIQRDLGIPAVYVTHDQAEAMVMSSRIIVMEGGRIAQEGNPESIYSNPKSRFVADFIGLSNFVDGEIAGEAGDGLWRVRSPLGEHECTGHSGYSPGDPVVVAIRPEVVELGSTAFAGAGAFDAKLLSRYFLGPSVEYFLDVAGTELRVQSRFPVSVEPGGRIFARVAPGHSQIVAH